MPENLNKIRMGLSGYVICASPRSGSSYLCQLLSSTGLLGYPREYFNSSLAGQRGRDPAYPANPRQQLECIFSYGATPNGIYGVKLFPHELDRLLSSRTMEHLPGLHYIWLTREDLLGQAISLLRARQTGRWGWRGTASVHERYDRLALSRCMSRIAEDDARWRMYFARNGIVPLPLTYFRIVEDPQASVCAVAEFLSVQDPTPIDWGRVNCKIMRDEQTELWRQRFLSEMADLNSLDIARSTLVRQVARRTRAALWHVIWKLTNDLLP